MSYWGEIVSVTILPWGGLVMQQVTNYLREYFKLSL